MAIHAGASIYIGFERNNNRNLNLSKKKTYSVRNEAREEVLAIMPHATPFMRANFFIRPFCHKQNTPRNIRDCKQQQRRQKRSSDTYYACVYTA